MTRLHRLSRRSFLRSLGAGTFTIAVLGPVLAACASDDDEVAPTTGDDPSPSSSNVPTSASATTTSTSTSTSAEPSAPGTTGAGPTAATLRRVNLGFVSAYVLARDGEAAIVDTGTPGNGAEIEAGLAVLGLGWANVGAVVLTHLHGDHIGSLGEVMTAATAADGFAGAADIPSIPSPRPLTAVGDGDSVFGLEVIETPGHTPGSISLLDAAGGILVAGDALNGADGGVAGANPGFTEDMSVAADSIRKLAGFTYSTVVFGHGDPVTTNASQLVAELAATL